MRPIATDTHDFPALRRDGCIYVDKTEFIHRLVSMVGSKLYFMSRPRRFGKSLTVSEMKRWYNGFRFAKGDPTTVYNPISIALTLYNKERGGFSATWATTGRPSMLMNYLKREDMLRIDIEATQRVREAAFDVAELRDLQPIAMLYQSGYLTVKDYKPATGLFTLGVPDEEVRQDLCMLMTGVPSGSSAFLSTAPPAASLTAPRCSGALPKHDCF